MAQRVFKGPLEQAQTLAPKRRSKDTFSFNGKNAWSGAISALDGVIEETHPYRDAKEYDFHHSFYFSEPAIERIGNGDSLFFYVDEDGNVQIDPIGRGQGYDKNALLSKILEQIKIRR